MAITSRTLLYSVMYIASVTASFLLYTLFWPLPVYLHLAIGIPIGLAVHLAFLEVERSRLDTPVDNSRLLEMADRIRQNVLVPVDIELWQRQSADPFIVSTYNAAFNAIIVSDPMVESMLETPESGEVLLAFHMLRMPKSRWILDLLGSMLVFFGVNAFMELLVLPSLSRFYASFFPPLWFQVLPLAAASVGLLPMVGLIVRGAFWHHEAAFEIVNELYGVHPQVAKLQVERVGELDSDETRAVLWGVLEWEKRKRSGRRVGIALAFIFGGVFVYAISVLSSGFFFYVTAFALVPLAAVALGFLAYIVVWQWDKRAMKEIEYATEGAREPIWMD